MIDELVVENQNLVHHICHKLYRKYSTLHEYEDLVGVGMIGLVRAAKRFKPELGYRFSTYAYRGIELEIINYTKDIGAGGVRIPRKEWQAGAGKGISCRSFQFTLGDDATLEDFLGIEQDLTFVKVDEFLKSIDPIDQKICEMKVAGHTQKKIADDVGLSQAQISRRLKLIRQKYTKYEGG